MSFDGAETSGTAQESYKNLSREDYDRYTTEYQPLEDEITDSVYNPERLGRKLSEARTDASTSFEAAEGVIGRQAGRYNQNLGGDAGALSKRKMDLARSLSIVEGQNTTRSNVKKRDFATTARQIAVGQRTRGNAIKMGGKAASAEVRENERNRERANEGLSKVLSTAGKLAAAYFTGGASSAVAGV